MVAMYEKRSVFVFVNIKEAFFCDVFILKLREFFNKITLQNYQAGKPKHLFHI